MFQLIRTDFVTGITANTIWVHPLIAVRLLERDVIKCP